MIKKICMACDCLAELARHGGKWDWKIDENGVCGELNKLKWVDYEEDWWFIYPCLLNVE